ncbi:MAG: DUF1993 domain-containing protein [Proteobacteria bacterium]|nr:DUF1993 domain-containing protein [Pseudomonadota bacterium]
MPISMSSASVPAFLQILGALSKVLDKAAAHCAARKIDPAVLLAMRLYPDMLPLVRQVHLTCDFAKNFVARVSGKDLPRFPDEEKTIDELKARIAKTIEAVKSVAARDIDGTEAKAISFAVGPRTMNFTGESYLVGFALPNFYFHASTAYDILRHCGVEVGKGDFLGAS